MKINHSCIEEALVISDRVLAFALNIINRSHYIFYSRPLAPENVSTWHSFQKGGTRMQRREHFNRRQAHGSV